MNALFAHNLDEDVGLLIFDFDDFKIALNYRHPVIARLQHSNRGSSSSLGLNMTLLDFDAQLVRRPVHRGAGKADHKFGATSHKSYPRTKLNQITVGKR